MRKLISGLGIAATLSLMAGAGLAQTYDVESVAEAQWGTERMEGTERVYTHPKGFFNVYVPAEWEMHFINPADADETQLNVYGPKDQAPRVCAIERIKLTEPYDYADFAAAQAELSELLIDYEHEFMLIAKELFPEDTATKTSDGPRLAPMNPNPAEGVTAIQSVEVPITIVFEGKTYKAQGNGLDMMDGHYLNFTCLVNDGDEAWLATAKTMIRFGPALLKHP